MSLQLAAKHLAAHGRGKDTELIHMDKGEIASLQQIAKANGGSLTINPQTGLPEAGFLSAILPMALGAGLMLVPGMQAYAAAGIVGGLKTMQSGSLKQGLMAGLGAYGGASMAGSFGTTGAVSQAAPSAGQAIAVDTDAMARAALPTQSNVAPNLLNAAPEQWGSIAPTAPTPTPTATPSSFADMNASQRLEAMKQGTSFGNAGDFIKANPYTSAGAAGSVAYGMQKDPLKPAEPDKDLGQRYQFTGNTVQPSPAPDVPTYDDMLTKQGNFGRQQNYFPQPKTYTAIGPTEAKDLYHFAGGGMPVEQMSNNAMMGTNTMYPMANISTSSYGTPDQMAEGGEAEEGNFLASIARAFGKGPKKQDENPGLKYIYNQDDQQYVQQQASGGISDAGYNLGGYSDGGRLLRGPGDGVSDSIPAVIGKKQPARLADGEFVVPARIVSEIGNGSTEAGARKLYGMMDRVQAARRQTVGKGKVAQNSRADKYLPA